MKFELSLSDITKETTDVIVNAANRSLLGGGGVDGAIHRVGGSQILKECQQIRARKGSCAVGEAVYTTGGNLPCKYVIHTVGPIWQGAGNESAKLANCYRNSLRLAEELGATSIAFPNISTGAYRFPKQSAAEIAVETVSGFEAEKIELVRFICFDKENYEIYQLLLERQ